MAKKGTAPGEHYAGMEKDQQEGPGKNLKDDGMRMLAPDKRMPAGVDPRERVDTTHGPAFDSEGRAKDLHAADGKPNAPYGNGRE